MTSAFLLSRWLFLADESLWLDEGWTWWVASLPADEMLRAIRADVVAPHYFVLLHAWTRAFGDGAFALRSPSAVLATLTIVPFAILVRAAFARPSTSVAPRPCQHADRCAVGSDRTAVGVDDPPSRGRSSASVVALALFSVSFMQSQYAREARPYALLCLLTLGALACVPTLAARRSRGAMLGFAACVAGGCYAHNVMPFYAACLAGAWLLWPGERSTRGRLADLAIVTGVVAIAYAPWLPTLREQARWMSGNFWASPPDAWAVGVALAAVAGVDVYAVPPAAWEWLGLRLSAGGVAAVTVTCVVLAAALPLLCSRGVPPMHSEPSTGMGGTPMLRSDRGRRVATALGMVAFGPMTFVFLYSRLGQPIFIERIFIAASAIVPLIVALPLASPRRGVRVAGGLVAGVMLALGVASTLRLLTTPQKEDWRGAHAYVAALPESSRRLIVFVAAEGELPFAHYVHQHATNDRTRPPERRTGAPGGFLDLDPPRTIRRVRSDADLDGLRATLAGGAYDEVVLVLGHADFADPQGRTEAWLRDAWRAADEVALRRVRVVQFRGPQPPSS